jgi:hypothetical protein
MTDYSDFKTSIAEWANRQDWSDILLTSFVRSAEEKLNAELRIDRQICTAENIVTNSCATLPDNWLESDLMMIATDQTPTGWRPINYKPRDEYFRLASTPYSGTYAVQSNSTWGYYTIEGRSIFFGGPVDDVEGTEFRLDYYAEVPVFSDTVPSWVYTKYSSLYRYAALMHADLHAVGEEDKAANLKSLVEDMINKLNMAHRYARASGSRLSRARVRSFG